jgi:hypothetical protein
MMAALFLLQSSPFRPSPLNCANRCVLSTLHFLIPSVPYVCCVYQIYDSLLKSYNQASDAHALVERVVTGSAAALRRELAEGIGLVDASAQSVTINEIRELCTHLTEVINDGDTMPEQAADPVDPMTGEVLQHVHSTWRAADDVHSSTRDVALMAIMGTFFDAHFAGEGEDVPNVLSVFGMEEEKISDVALGDAAQAQVCH